MAGARVGRRRRGIDGEELLRARHAGAGEGQQQGGAEQRGSMDRHHQNLYERPTL
jgi:hypothetical protein